MKKRLRLNRVTLRDLEDAQVTNVAGASYPDYNCATPDTCDGSPTCMVTCLNNSCQPGCVTSPDYATCGGTCDFNDTCPDTCGQQYTCATCGESCGQQFTCVGSCVQDSNCTCK